MTFTGESVGGGVLAAAIGRLTAKLGERITRSMLEQDLADIARAAESR
ncbi:MAG: hypothetical protein QM809_16380 [Gordonia sp. (in: high G+C Gram-positive bacteria)]